MFDAAINEERAPAHWSEPCLVGECRLHQLAPYIGKLKSSIAKDLISAYSKEGDLVLDPFCGSGTVPLQAALMGRRAMAFDVNPYAITLTRGKLNPPDSLEDASTRLDVAVRKARRFKSQSDSVPRWVKQSFHPRTMSEVVKFVKACVSLNDYFLLACLLGILHHQRPGFLSYPSSHLVPYLRTKKFPRSEYPEMYAYRDIQSRMTRKISRALSGDFPISHLRSRTIHVERRDILQIRSKRSVDAIITSPPYMNALDYKRDNRLRMWFLDDKMKDYAPEPTDKRDAFAKLIRAFCGNALPTLKDRGFCVLVVGETVRRKRMTSHPATQVTGIMSSANPEMKLVRVIEDEIPDVRRARRGCTGTKTELILVFQKRSPVKR